MANNAKKSVPMCKYFCVLPLEVSSSPPSSEGMASEESSIGSILVDVELSPSKGRGTGIPGSSSQVSALCPADSARQTLS